MIKDVETIWGKMKEIDVTDFEVVKLIETVEATSLQVHPNSDEYWLILETTKENAVIGLCEGTAEHINWIPVKAGDFFIIPKHKIHCIGGGIKLLEIKEFEDVTIRINDWGRNR